MPCLDAPIETVKTKELAFLLLKCTAFHLCKFRESFTQDRTAILLVLDRMKQENTYLVEAADQCKNVAHCTVVALWWNTMRKYHMIGVCRHMLDLFVEASKGATSGHYEEMWLDGYFMGWDRSKTPMEVRTLRNDFRNMAIGE